MNPRLALALRAAFPLVSFASTSHADPPVDGDTELPPRQARLPVAQAERPLTLPRFVLSPEVTPGYAHGIGISVIDLSLGASFGITDNLTVRALVLPLELGGEGVHVGQISGSFGPSIGASYRVLRGTVEIASAFDAAFITLPDLTGVVLTPSVPVRIHATPKLRIDTGLYLPIQFASIPGPNEQEPAVANPAFGGNTPDNSVGLRIPVSVLYDIIEPLHVGITTGFAIDDFSDVGDTATIPLGFFTGYAIAGRDGPIVDIDPFFTFTNLFNPAVSPSAEFVGGDPGIGRVPTDTVHPLTVETRDYVVGVSVTGFLYL